MPYTTTTLATAVAEMGRRLYDPTHIHWLEPELKLYIQQAIRTFNALTNHFRDGVSLSTTKQQAFYDRYAAIPDEILSGDPQDFVATGEPAASRQGFGCVTAPPTYHKIPALSVLTAMFLHGGWLHLLGNMLFLWIFGNNVEDRMGHLRYLLFYLFAGYVATYGFAVANPTSMAPLIVRRT